MARFGGLGFGSEVTKCACRGWRVCWGVIGWWVWAFILWLAELQELVQSRISSSFLKTTSLFFKIILRGESNFTQS